MQPRAWQNEDDLLRAKKLLETGWAAARHSGYIHYGDLDWRLFYILPPEAQAEALYLWEDTGSKLIAFALIDGLAFETYVLPHLRGTAFQYAVFDWCEMHLRDQLASSKQATGVLKPYSFDDDTDWIDFLTRRGYSPSKEGFAYLLRSLKEPIPEPSLPEGFSLRGMQGPEDAELRAAAHISAFNSKRMTTEKYKHFMKAPDYRLELDSVCVAPDGRIAAYAMGWLDERNKIGEFEPVGTHQDFQRKGLGKAVMLRGLRTMQEHGMQEAIVYAHEHDPASVGLYQSVGFKIVNGFRDYTCEFKLNST